MFCDLVGSTTLSSRLDPEDLREVIRSYQSCVANTIQQFDGFIARYVGDGVVRGAIGLSPALAVPEVIALCRIAL